MIQTHRFYTIIIPHDEKISHLRARNALLYLLYGTPHAVMSIIVFHPAEFFAQNRYKAQYYFVFVVQVDPPEKQAPT